MGPNASSTRPVTRDPAYRMKVLIAPIHPISDSDSFDRRDSEYYNKESCISQYQQRYAITDIPTYICLEYTEGIDEADGAKGCSCST